MLLIVLGVGALGLGEDLDRFAGTVPTVGYVKLPSGSGLVPEYTRECIGEVGRGGKPSDAVRTAIEAIRKTDKVRRELSPDNYPTLFRLLDELDSCGEFGACEVAMQSFLTSVNFTDHAQQDSFIRYAESHPFRILSEYLAREDWAGARRHVRRIVGWLEAWDPPPNIASASYSSFELQAFMNVMYRLDALLDDFGIFFRDYESAVIFLRSTTSGKELTPDKLNFLKNSKSSEMRAWAYYLEAASLLRKREFEAASRTFGAVVANTRNDRLRDLALLGTARSHYWRVRNKQMVAASGKTSINVIKDQIKRSSLINDIEYYVANLEGR